MKPGALRDFVLILSVSLLLSFLILVFFAKVVKGLLFFLLGALLTPIIFVLIKQMLPGRRLPGPRDETP